MSKIRVLSDEVINQIAAGEIIEAPCSALKEIIENSIDANARNIEVFLKNGGKSKIVVDDDGDGIQSEEDLKMCILRHATSKLSGNNLFDINSYGFRGEALPSIASISNLSIESNGRGISVDFSEISEPYVSSVSRGTRVCIANMFDRTPVRLKFLKSDNAELAKCLNVIENFSLTTDSVSFVLRTDNKTLISYRNDSLESRISKIYGVNLFEKAIYFEEKSESISARGYLFHPSHSKYSSLNAIRLFVNNRIVKDRIVSMALKIGYRNVIEGNRYPMAVLYIDIDPLFVDINISPTKSEIRFRDEQSVQRFLIKAITNNIQSFNRVSLDFNTSRAAAPDEAIANNSQSFNRGFLDFDTQTCRTTNNHNAVADHQIIDTKEETHSFFGEAIAQVFDTYIISYKRETEEVFIIDQHAVHEKMVMNKIIDSISNNENSQYLMRPEVVNVSALQMLRYDKITKTLTEFGFRIDAIGHGTRPQVEGSAAIDAFGNEGLLIIRAIPGSLSNNEAFQIIADVLSDENDEVENKREYIRKRIADIACHNSIRGGRPLSIDEMNCMIHDMENTENVFQCNHHRPSFLRLLKKDLEKMFERS
ncbi:MAG: DNA mismatch repair endonuclease MutL [Holosporales bacterium]|jgi:DNA mismatch repair protein MutL|nr:DNA mismatch repair endonuclease MutL [Holosporales bacterium]